MSLRIGRLLICLMPDRKKLVNDRSHDTGTEVRLVAFKKHSFGPGPHSASALVLSSPMVMLAIVMQRDAVELLKWIRNLLPFRSSKPTVQRYTLQSCAWNTQ